MRSPEGCRYPILLSRFAISSAASSRLFPAFICRVMAAAGIALNSSSDSGTGIRLFGSLQTTRETSMPNSLEMTSARDTETASADAESKHPQAAGADAGSGQQVEIVPIVRLTAYKGNARTHTKKQIRQIADSITRFGFCNPILIDDANQIIAGHGRVEAAKLLGLEGVPTLRIAHLSEAEKRAYVMADNRLAELAGWDREI